MSTTCERSDLNDLVPQYLAGRLSTGQVEEIEVHLLDCCVCWDEVRLGAALRRGHRLTRRRPVAAGIVIGLATASILIGVLTWPPGNPYRDLGRVVTAPRSAPVALRSETRAPLAVLDSAMAAYGAGDYRTAERLLTRGTTESSQPGAWFFLGVTRLLLDRPSEAVPALRRAVQPEGNAFEAEAELYLAKAFLQLGDADSALAHLRLAESSPATLREAAALRRIVEQVSRAR